MSVIIIIYLSLFILFASSNSAISITGDTGIIHVPNANANRDSASFNLIQAQTYYVKSQSPSIYEQNTATSNIFTTLPGLMMPFNHTTPMLYKINFRGDCRIVGGRRLYQKIYAKIMIDDKLLVGSKLYPNNNNRHLVQPGLASNLDEFDCRGGGCVTAVTVNESHWYSSSCSISETIYLAAGIHVVNVGIRTTNTFKIVGGILNVELIQYDRTANIGIQVVT